MNIFSNDIAQLNNYLSNLQKMNSILASHWNDALYSHFNSEVMQPLLSMLSSYIQFLQQKSDQRDLLIKKVEEDISRLEQFSKKICVQEKTSLHGQMIWALYGAPKRGVGISAQAFLLSPQQYGVMTEDELMAIARMKFPHISKVEKIAYTGQNIQ